MHADAVGEGSVALARMREAAGGDGAYDLVLLDFQMPGLDGLEVARTMAADLSLGGVRVILLTSAGDERHAAREAGVALTLTKPVGRGDCGRWCASRAVAASGAR